MRQVPKNIISWSEAKSHHKTLCDGSYFRIISIRSSYHLFSDVRCHRLQILVAFPSAQQLTESGSVLDDITRHSRSTFLEECSLTYLLLLFLSSDG